MVDKTIGDDMEEYNKIKRVYEEFLEFKKINNKPKGLVIDIESIKENLKINSTKEQSDHGPSNNLY